jgi:peptidoglycan/xylan/chitin deacetylase (PgdA/CDA1 family)/N-acetyl-beta-hexosaminidase
LRVRLFTLRRIIVLVLTAAAVMVAFASPGAATGGSAVTVSITFDDGWDSQQTAATMLAAHGLKGTFYVNSPNIDQPGYLSWSQLTTLDAAGNEIGGHTLTHPDLTTLTSAQAQHEVCDDRTNIRNHGFAATDFAYPFGGYDSNTGAGSLDVSSIVKNCGYSSGRGAFGLHNITAANDTRPYATSTSPSNLYKILTPCCINYATSNNSTPTAAALESYVQHAETETSPNPGWVVFFFHRVCDNCGGDDPAPSISPSEFNAFLDWLNSSSSGGATVKTVAQVIKKDTQPPTTTITCGGASCSSGWYGGPVTVSLSASDSGTSGVFATHYTTDGSEPTVASPLYTGPFTVSASGATTVKFRSWDSANNVEATKSQTIQVDTTAPSSSIACNGTACSGWYPPGVSVSLSSGDGQSGVASIHYTTDGADPTLASPTYTGPFTVSATTSVKYRAWDNAGNAEATNTQLIQIDATAPSSTISCGGGACSSGWYTSAVSVALSATDGESGVSVIRYTTDGSDPTASSTAYSGPFTVSSTTTVKYRAWDNAGNVESTNTQVIQIDTTAPSSSIACNGATCSGWYAPGASVSLSASDTGSGVASIHYTTDGSDPTFASPTYTAPVTVVTTTTVKYRAWDNAGNAGQTNTQLIQIDTTAPTSTISCNGAPCSTFAYLTAVTVTMSATDAESGVSVIRYTTDGSDPTASSTAYSGPFTVSSTTTVKYRAWDNAGNVESTNTQVVTISVVVPDTTPPASSISCNQAVCSTGWYNASVGVSLSASDAGSGVSSIHYTTDGTDPTLASPTYTAPFTVSATTTVKYRAWDNAGNVEPTNTQLIQIDTTAPTTTIRCNDATCGTWYTAQVSVSLSATDGQSGVASTHYTTDGSDPTLASPAYAGPVTVSATTTVKYRAWDSAGNVEATKTQLIRIDTLAPTVAITSPTAGSSVTGTVKISATATDNSGGSGVAQVSFYADGKLIATATSTAKGAYSVSWNTKKVAKGGHTLTAIATDVAGNTQTSMAVLVTVT